MKKITLILLLFLFAKGFSQTANIVATKTPPVQSYMYQQTGNNQTITYYLQVGNNGDDDATNVNVDIPVPGDIVAAEVTWTGDNGTSGTGALSDIIATLDSGEVVTYQIVMPIAVGFDWTTDMLVSGDVTISSGSVDDDIVFLLTNGAYVPGTNAVYTITVTNNGPDDAENVVVSDVISIPGVDLSTVMWTGSNGTSGTGSLTDTIAELENGETITYTVTIPTPASLNQIIVNTVEVTSDTPNDNNVCIGCTSYAAPMAYADLQISKEVTNNCYLTGDWVEYIITVSNDGPSNAQNVVVHDPIFPLYNSYGIVASQMNWTGSNASAGTGTLSNTIPTLAVGQTITYTLNIFIPETVNTANAFVNRVYVSSNTPDPDPDLNPNQNNGFGQQMAQGAIAACPDYVTVNTTLYTPQELITDVLVDMDCALIENITAQGYPVGMGYFHANNSDFPLKEGIILRCGPAAFSQGPYNNTNQSGTGSGTGDTELHAISVANGQSGAINDVSYLQFEFTPINDFMSFNFLFSSNEYGTYQCTFADVFAFILTDLTTGIQTNLAVIPDTTTPVSVVNIKDGAYNSGCPSQNIEYFGQMNVTGDPINMKGQTIVMQASSPVVPCRKYRIKLAIGDYGDSILDSAVFLEAGSFDIGSLDLGDDYVIEQGTAICPEDTVILNSGLTEIDDGCNITYSYQWYYNGDIIPGAITPTYEVPEGEAGFYELYTNILIAGDVVDIDCDLNPAGVVVEFYPPLPAGEPEDIVTCDGVFDLTEAYDALYGDDLTDGDVAITFHLNMTDLENWWNLEWNAPYPQLTEYTAISNPQTIYVRVQDLNSDCFVVRSFDLITEECQFEAPEDIVLCDNDKDGSETVDLAQFISDLLDGFDNHNVSFHTSETGANTSSSTDVIDHTVLYVVPVGTTATVWIRLEDNDDTTLYETDSFTITVNAAPDIDFIEGTILELCDDDTDEIAVFNLTTVGATITTALPGMVVSYYTSDTAAQDGTGAITTPGAYANTSNPQTIWVRAVNADGCYGVSWVVLQVNPLPEFNEPEDLAACDDNFDGVMTWDLTVQTPEILVDVLDEISYYTSQANAQNETNTIANPESFTNTTNPQTIWVRVENEHGCFIVTSFDLIVFSLPNIETPTNYTLCDDDVSDGFTEFDLTTKDDEILNNPNDVISYYESQTDAQNGTNPIADPESYTNTSSPQTIWVRVETANGCFVTTSFDLNVIGTMDLPTPTPLEVCDDNNDGFAVFNLTPVIDEVTGGDTSLNVFFYTTTEAALAGEGHITTIVNFTNTVANMQTLYIRVTPEGQDCPSYTTVTLIVHPKPVIPNLTNYQLCDDNTDGFMEFDLTTKDQEILDGSTNDLTYHLTLADAQNGENEITTLTNFTNQTINQQTIYVRVENEFGCFDVSQFNIIVRPLPEVFVLEPLYVCNDGVNPDTAPFMLTDRTAAASGGVTGTTITYHETIAEAENNLNALSSPYMGTNNQIIVVKAQSQYGCVSYMTLTLMIVDAPVDPVLDPLEYCDLNSDGIGIFDLTTVIPIIETANISPTVISFHGTYDDAFYDANNLTINNDITAFVNSEWYNQTIYIRIEGVTECFTIAELQLIVHDLPQITDPEPFEMCDDDYDGFVAFDLSSINEEVLGSLNPLTHEVSYFTTESDAHNNTNEIGNITTYTNQIINEDTVWVRVDDQETGCYDLAELTLIVNPLPIVSMPEVPEYRLCDEDGDGFVEFDLQTQIAGIINGQAGLEVTFHDTYEDAELNQNPFEYLHTNSPAFVETVFVRVETEKGCFVITLLDLIADPLPTLTMPADPVISCDGDGDGYGVINLEELVEDMLNGADPTEFEVNFYETYLNAEEAQNALLNPEAYFNSNAFTQIIYVRVDNLVSGCFTIYPLTLTVETAPEIPVDANNELPEIELCDDNFDGITYFDFTEQTNYILAAQLDITNLVVTYHQTQEDAENGTLAIATPDHYQNITTPQIIWVRLENTETECFDTASFEIIVNIPLEIPENLQLTVCDGDSDGIVEFDLTGMNPTILSNASNPNNYQVDFFLTLEDAQTDTNIIENPTNFSNQQLGGGGVYTIYVRVIDLVTGCESYRSLTIRRAPMPNPLTTNIVPLELCDAITEDDMMEEFDLTSYEDYIRNGDNNLIFTYHLSQEEAENNENAIITPEAYFTGSTMIYIRISNQPNDSQNCTVVIELELIVNPLPTVAQNYYAICNENSTGFEAFDLNGFTPTLLGPTQNPDDFLVEYYLSLADAEDQINPINQGVPFENVSQGSQTIYVHIYNTITECERVAEFTLYAEEAAVAHPVDDDIKLCDYDGTNDGILEVNLDEHWQDAVLNGQDPIQFAVTYHFSEADAENGENAIPNPTAYTNTDSPYSQMIYIRVENTNTLSPCYDIAVAQLLVEPLAEPVITSNYTHLCVNADGSIGRTVELNSNITDPNYTFEWFHNGTLIEGETQSTYTIDQFGGEGEYYVIATSTNPYFECESDPSDVITIGLSGSATVVYIESTNAFENQQDIIVTVDGYGEYLYQLDNGPLQSTGHFVNVSPGAHTVTVYDVLPGDGDVDDYNNCDAISEQNVSVVNYPHYFTPNGDGYHDRWNITGLNAFHNAEIYIFDRYGKLLKQLNPTGDGWDGTFNGTPLPASDYWFKVVYDEPVTDSEGITTTRRKEFKAHFSIKR